MTTTFRRRLQSLGAVDLVIGLPVYKNSRTITEVIGALAAGLGQHFPDARAVFVVADSGTNDETLRAAQGITLPRSLPLLTTEYHGLAGKGGAVRAIMESADLLKAAACTFVDIDTKGMTPQWIENLVRPVLSDGADLVTPIYHRDKHEITISDLIVQPFTAGMYGWHVHQPLGSEMSVSPRAWQTYLARDVWETDVARFGIHIWMVTLAINSGWQLAEASLGLKVQDFKDPTVGFEPKFMQVIGTMFRLMAIYRRVWPEVHSLQLPRVYGELPPVEVEAVPPTRPALWDGFIKGVKRYRRNMQQILSAEHRELLRALGAGEPVELTADHWARMMMDFAVVYNRGEGDPDKVALALLPLYYARKATLLKQLEGQPWSEIDREIDRQVEAFVEAKPYLVERWATYLPWQAR